LQYTKKNTSIWYITGIHRLTKSGENPTNLHGPTVDQWGWKYCKI